MELHALTRAYEAISDPGRREAYDKSIGYDRDSLVTRPLPRKRLFLVRWLRKRASTWQVDPHEVLGLHPSTNQTTVPEAYRLMRNCYLRLARGHRRETLLKMVDEAYAVVGDPERRASLRLGNPGNSAADATSIDKRTGRTASRKVVQPKPQHLETTASQPIPDTTATKSVRSNLSPVEGRGSADAVIRRAGRGLKTVAVAFGRLLGGLARFIGRATRAGAGASSRAVGHLRSNRAEVSERRQQQGNVVPPDDLFLGRLASRVGDSEARKETAPTGNHTSGDESL